MKDMKLSDLAKKLGLTRARVYQFVAEKLIKVKHTSGFESIMYVEAAEASRFISAYRSGSLVKVK